jgi:uncharacterized YccA/Bax inhibitor family protein
MNRSNPALHVPTFDSRGTAMQATDLTDRMTVQGAATKSLVLLALTIFSASWVWSAMPARPDLAGPAILIGALGGLAVAMLTIFRPQSAPWSAPIYAVVEGIALGAISASLQSVPALRGIPVRAVGLTFAVALGMLFAYEVGLIRATPTFRRVVISATFGIAVFYLLTMVLGFFGVRMPFLGDGSPLGIGISLAITGVAALNLVLDFDVIEQGAHAGAPKYMEWYGAFALLVTLVWLYLEILRLLSLLQRRR